MESKAIKHQKLAASIKCKELRSKLLWLNLAVFVKIAKVFYGFYLVAVTYIEGVNL